MRVFTVHARAGRRPVLVPERFSWGAAVFGPLWLARHGAWAAAAVALLASLAIGTAPAAWQASAGLALAALLGFCGQDVRRWSLWLRGFSFTEVVAGADADAALLRLLDARPDLAASRRP